MRASGASSGSLTRAFTCFHMDILARFRTHFHTLPRFQATRP